MAQTGGRHSAATSEVSGERRKRSPRQGPVSGEPQAKQAACSASCSASSAAAVGGCGSVFTIAMAGVVVAVSVVVVLAGLAGAFTGLQGAVEKTHGEHGGRELGHAVDDLDAQRFA